MARTRTTTPSATDDVAARFAPLTEDDIREQTDQGSYSRGRSYYRQGRIHDTVLRGDAIEALCTGSDYAPYRVTATLTPSGTAKQNPSAFSCSCPRGGFCKHVVAMLLTWVHNPGQFLPRATLADTLAGRSQHELITLIERMVERHPELERLVDIPVPPAPDETGSPNVVSVDEMSVRRMVRSALNEFSPYDRSGGGWGDSWGYQVSPPPELRSALNLGQRYAETSQWANAVVVFSSLVEEVFEEADEYLFNYDEEGEAVGIITDADNGLADALEAQAALPVDQRLDAEMRERLIGAIYGIWHYEIFDAGGIGLGDRGIEALLQHATGDERTTVEGWLREETGSEWGKRAATEFRVDLHEAAGASGEELLAIYREAEQWDDVAVMQVNLERLDDAVATVRQHLRAAPDVINVATAMLTRGGDAIRRAITMVDDFAWETEGDNERHDASLKQWLMNQYGRQGRPEDALKLSEQLFRKRPHLSSWNEVKHAATLPDQPQGTWDALRPKLIDHLREQEMWSLLVDIHLADSDVAAALEAFDRLDEWARKRQAGRDLRGMTFSIFGGQDLRLAQAAEREFPDRAVAIYTGRAQDAIEARNRGSYQSAAGYLNQVKAILERENRRDEWKKLIGEIRETNARLPALQDEMTKAGLG